MNNSINTNDTLNEYIDICICSNGSHYDVSKVIYELIKDKFSYLSLSSENPKNEVL
jgi:hypothetical protein